MPTLNDGTFSKLIPTADLARGLRPSRYVPRDARYLVDCVGTVAMDGVLQTLEDLNDYLINSAIITDGFPYPQIFLFNNVIVVCGETKIYEYIAGALVLELTTIAGVTWCAVDFNDYIYMSNGRVGVRRRAEDKVWEETTEVPIASGICDFNGQVLIGAEGVELT